MTYLQRFKTLTWSQRRLLLEAYLWLGLARAAVLTLPFQRIMRALGQTTQAPAPQPAPQTLPELRQIAWAIHTISSRTPWHSNCLAQALAGQIMLRRRGMASTLYLGVQNDGTAGFTAHAWLRSSDLIVTGGGQLERYKVIAHFNPKR